VNGIHEFPGQGTLESSRLPDVGHSVVAWSVFVIGSALTYLCFSEKAPLSRRPPNVTGMSLHMITFTKPFPVLVLQATMLGYQARSMVCLLYCCTLAHVSCCLTMGAIWRSWRTFGQVLTLKGVKYPNLAPKMLNF